MKYRRGFASDNNPGVHPRIMEAVLGANEGHVSSYGDDPFTDDAKAAFANHFGDGCDVYFVWGGTAANVLGLSAITLPHQAVICPDTAHINRHECGAPERFAGCKLLTVETGDGKLCPRMCDQFLDTAGDVHEVQPAVISISQPTELGTVYTVEEIRDIAEYAHTNGMKLHMDGARLPNAAVSLDVRFREMTFDAGVDVLAFGGTKNGMMFGEAVVFSDKTYARTFQYVRKQGMQLMSKMRFVSAQFSAFLADGLLFDMARQENNMARRLADGLERLPGVIITQPVESNGVFVRLPEAAIERAGKDFHFYILDSESGLCRLMISFDTTERDVDEFVAAVLNALQ